MLDWLNTCDEMSNIFHLSMSDFDSWEKESIPFQDIVNEGHNFQSRGCDSEVSLDSGYQSPPVLTSLQDPLISSSQTLIPTPVKACSPKKPECKILDWLSPNRINIKQEFVAEDFVTPTKKYTQKIFDSPIDENESLTMFKSPVSLNSVASGTEFNANRNFTKIKHRPGNQYFRDYVSLSDFTTHSQAEVDNSKTVAGIQCGFVAQTKHRTNCCNITTEEYSNFVKNKASKKMKKATKCTTGLCVHGACKAKFDTTGSIRHKLMFTNTAPKPSQSLINARQKLKLALEKAGKREQVQIVATLPAVTAPTIRSILNGRNQGTPCVISAIQSSVTRQLVMVDKRVSKKGGYICLEPLDKSQTMGNNCSRSRKRKRTKLVKVKLCKKVKKI